MMVIFMMFFIYMMIMSNRLLMNLIMVEIFSIIFMVNFLFINVFMDNLFVIIFSFFILESVMGLMMLILLINYIGYDYNLINLYNY